MTHLAPKNLPASGHNVSQGKSPVNAYLFLYSYKPYFQVSNILSGLKNMALDMGDTIESQNTQIDRINDKAEQNELRVAAANERSEKILNGKKKK